MPTVCAEGQPFLYAVGKVLVLRAHEVLGVSQVHFLSLGGSPLARQRANVISQCAAQAVPPGPTSQPLSMLLPVPYLKNVIVVKYIQHLPFTIAFYLF